jgi:NADP-dependent 3-hydroxy acid dehydrogenase YdfG
MSQLVRTILVTGASSGIGRAIAENLLQQNHHVIGLSRRSSQFIADRQSYSSLQMDLSDLQHLPENIKSIQKRFPDIDSIIFCAGTGRFGSLEEFSFEQIQALININFTSQIIIARGFLPLFKNKGQGNLIFIGSEAALQGRRKGTVYCAAKFAIRGFAQALREECATSNVRVALINPGMVKSEFFDDLTFTPGEHHSNFLLPEDVAEIVSFVLHSRSDIVFDEINLNPLNKVVNFKKKDK